MISGYSFTWMERKLEAFLNTVRISRNNEVTTISLLRKQHASDISYQISKYFICVRRSLQLKSLTANLFRQKSKRNCSIKTNDKNWKWECTRAKRICTLKKFNSVSSSTRKVNRQKEKNQKSYPCGGKVTADNQLRQLSARLQISRMSEQPFKRYFHKGDPLEFD